MTTESHYTKSEMDTNNEFHVVPHDSTTNDALDTSQWLFPREIWFILPSGEVAAKLGTFVPVILFGVLGNALLMTIILKNRGLRTATNLLVANMAFADLLTLLVCPAMFMAHDFYQSYELGRVGCKMEGFLEGTLLITSVLNLASVSYDRLTAIVLPQEAKLTLKGAYLVIVSTWTAGIFLALPLLIFRTYKTRIWLNFVERYCVENINVLPMYWHVLISAIVWFPLGVMTICYSAIFWKLDRYEASVLKREHPISVSYKKRVARMLFIVLATFVILRTPYTVLIFIRNQMLKTATVNSVDGAFNVLWYISHYLVFLNSAINPIIYGVTNDNFRRAFNQLPFAHKLQCCTKHSEKNQLLSNQRQCNAILSPGGGCAEYKSASGRWFNFSNKSETSMTSQSTLESPRSHTKSREIEIISTAKLPDEDFYKSNISLQQQPTTISNGFI